MTPLVITPEHVGHRVIVRRTQTQGLFEGRAGTLVEWRTGKGRGSGRARVQLDNDPGYSWLFEPRELELVEGTATSARGEG